MVTIPAQGQGANQALTDAVLLAECLDDARRVAKRRDLSELSIEARASEGADMHPDSLHGIG